MFINTIIGKDSIMCDAGSYVDASEVEDIDNLEYVKNKGNIFFVTSDDLKKGKGKEMAESGASLQGHNAIVAIHGIKRGVGVEKEADLSNPDNCPAPIADAVRKGKFVGIFIKRELLSDKGLDAFDKAVEKIEKAKTPPKKGAFYATTEAFWKIFTSSARNRCEAWRE